MYDYNPKDYSSAYLNFEFLYIFYFMLPKYINTFYIRNVKKNMIGLFK